MNYKHRREWFDGNEITLAPFHTRAVAMLIDFGLVILLYVALANSLKVFGFGIDQISIQGFGEIELATHNMTKTEKSVLEVILSFLPTIYFSLFIYFTKGQTPGKKIMRIKIISLYHQRIGFWHCIERSLGYVASTLELGLGFLQVLWNPNRMALHDRIAETVVIKTGKYANRVNPT